MIGRLQLHRISKAGMPISQQARITLKKTMVTLAPCALPVLPPDIQNVDRRQDYREHQEPNVDRMPRCVLWSVTDHVSDMLRRVNKKKKTYASFFRYVKVAMKAAQFAIASWKPVPVALV